jgi:hypothetical protein
MSLHKRVERLERRTPEIHEHRVPDYLEAYFREFESLARKEAGEAEQGDAVRS